MIQAPIRVMSAMTMAAAICVFSSACDLRRDDHQGTSSKSAKEEQATDPEVSLQFSILRQWKPNDEPNGYGAEILLEEKIDGLEEGDLVAFVRELARDHDPANIRIFSSREAYNQEQSNDYGPEYKSDYLLFYVKNETRRGAYRGLNEIRWMQEVGKFSGKYGKKTQF